MKALVGAFNQEKALVGAFSVIVKTDRSFTALILRPCVEKNLTMYAQGGEAAVWLRRGQVVYRGALCPLTGHWFWSRAAGCDCFNYQEEAEQDVCIQE